MEWGIVMTEYRIERISDTITYIHLNTRKIALVGTAHVSAESLEEVENTIRHEFPDHVCVELDESRLKRLEEGQKWSKTDIKKILRNGQGFMMMANLALSSFQRRMSLDTGVAPGAEMKAAVHFCRESQIPFTCADRSIQVTLSRAWRKSGFFTKVKLLASLLSSVFSKEKASAKEIEKLKKMDIMQGMMNELANYLPSVKKVLIDERDFFLASKIFNAPGEKIVAVVGAAHVPGITVLMEKMALGEESGDTSEIETIPHKKWISKFLPWLIPLIIGGIFITGIFRWGMAKGLEMGLVWFLANGILASLGALIALAHPLTILLSFIGAPVTSLNPMIGIGMVAGLLEYMLRTPRVIDLENIHSELNTLRGWYRNRVTRILLVFFLSSLGSVIGTAFAIPWLASVLGRS